MSWHAIRRRVHSAFDLKHNRNAVSLLVNYGILALIVLNIVAMIAESVPGQSPLMINSYAWIAFVSLIVFSLEYVLRVWASVESERYQGRITGRLRYMLTPMAIVDLLAVLPSLLPFVGLDFRFMRALRILRLMQVAKLGRYSTALQTVGRVFFKKREELLVTLSLLMFLLLITSILVYYAERDAQPEAFGSIPHSMWWAVATLTTVGYGDMYPITTLGRLMGACVAILGIGIFALPTSILGAGFLEEVTAEAETINVTCPHCGNEFHTTK